MALNVQSLKDSLKKVDYCQPMHENTIEQDLINIRSAIEVLVNAESLDEEFFASDKFVHPTNKLFFINELPFHACKYIIEFKQFTNRSNDLIARNILLLSLELCLKVFVQYPDQVKSLETLRYIIDPDRQYYRFHSQAELDDTKYTPDIELSAEQLVFCQGLNEGDKVDCIKFDARSSVADWSRGTISKASERYVWVKWHGDDETSQRKVFRYSWDLAPWQSKVPDEEWQWRFNLDVNDMVDCPDDNVWYNSTVVERTVQYESDSDPVIELKIGFRYFDPNGPLIDPKTNQKFFGWSNQYDEDMNATNPRLQRLNKYSKKFCKYASMSYAEESIKDQSDFLFEYKQPERIYAVPRFNTRNQRRSQVMLALIQRFGQLGAFQLFLDRLSSVQQWCSIDSASLFLAILGNMHEMLTRSFCYDYVPQLWEASYNNIYNSPDSNLRNFSSTKITDALQGLGSLLKRVYSLKEKTEMIDKLEMNVALRCFNSDFLERKLQGLKAIQELLRKTKDYQMTMQNSDIKFLSTQVMVEWINDNKIFEQLYVQNTNSHLIQRSSDFLKFMLDEHLVTIEHMEMVWASARRNETEQKLAVYKVLKDVSSSLSKEHLDFLVDRVCEKEALQLTKDDVELLGDLTRYNYRYREEFCLRFSDFYWNLLLSAAKLPQPLVDQIVQYYIDQVNSFEMRPHRQSQLTKIGQGILSGAATTNVGLRVLQKFIDKLEVQALSWDSFTRNVALTELENQFKITTSIVNRLENVKQSFLAAEITQQQYLDDVRARMAFIQFCNFIIPYPPVYSNISTNELRLSFTVITALWDQLVCRSASTEERDLLYKWFSSLAANGQALTAIVNQEDLKSFFDTKMTYEHKQLQELTPEGFNCFKAVFSALNVQSNNIQQIQKETSTYTQAYNQFFANQYGPQVNPANSKIETTSKTETTCLVDPTTLYGFKSLWTIITDANLLPVSKQANEYLQDLYANLKEGVELAKPILEFLFDELKVQKDDANKIFRILLVLEDAIDQSEVNGQGNLKSLNALRTSEQATIQIINEHNGGPLIPKKFSVQILETQTIIELRHVISKQIRAPWDTIGLQSTKGEVKFTENGKMVKDLRLKKGETLIVNKRYTSELPEMQLLDAENNLTPETRVVFGELFDEYSQGEKMNKEQCARFVQGCTGNPCSQDDTQISRLFEQHDKDKDGLLTLNDFVEFYTDAARTKKSTVWQNLHTLNYRNDMLRGDRVPLPVVQSGSLPRSIITRSSEWMSQLFSLLDSPNLQLQEQAWYLLRRLPPSPQYFRKIVTFEGIKTAEDWDSVFSIHSNFRLLYSLHIVEFLMSNNSESNINFLALLESDTIGQDPQPLELKSQDSILTLKDKWMSEFLSLGGFDRLFQFFKNYQGRSVSQLDINEKEILSFLLNTFSQYLVAACALRLNGAYRTSQLIIAQQSTAVQTLQQLRTGEFEEPSEFKELLKKLKDGLGDSIIKMFSLETFVPVLRSLIDELLSSTRDLEPEDRSVIEYALVTIVTVLLYDQRLATSSVGDDEFLRVLFDGLYTEKSSNVRSLFSRAILLFCHQSHSMNRQILPSKVILERLTVNIRDDPQSEDEQRAGSSDFYDLICALIDTICQQGQSSIIEFNKLAQKVVDNLLSHASTESRAKNTQVDGTLVGLLNLLEKLVSVDPSLRQFLKHQYKTDLVSVVFNECLFSLGQPAREVKCKSSESRAVAYKLLLTMAQDTPDSLTALVGALQQLSQRIPAMAKWNYVPAQDMRSPNGFVGIRNLGCICYMNAMLQQFYMTPTFRYGILMADDGEAPRIEVRASDSAKIDDNVLHQIQQMFAYLELSDRVDYNPHEFCFAFKDFSGEPVNVLVQQDAQEFLNMIFDKLETALKPTPFKYIMDGVYGGKTCTQLVCTKCSNVRTKEEQYYNLSLPIKNLKNLNECFEKYIEGETISDFSCEACGQKVDVTKRQLLSTLPNVLILHLQRIVFNLDTLMNEKINTKLEFPNELDLKGYTVNPEQQTDATKYRLAGVVVHYGTAEFGHYFSYIDIKRQQKELFQPPDQWLEFNDSKIKEFKTKQIEHECFGGASSDVSCEDEMWGWGKYGRENSQNAYILVYEKFEKEPIKLVFENEQQLVDAQKQFQLPLELQVEHKDDKLVVNLQYHDLKQHVPEHLTTRVSNDNQQFLLERNLFNPELQKFLLDTLTLIGNNESTNETMVEVLLKFSFDLIARANDNKLLETFVTRLRELLTPKSSLVFLENMFFSKVQRTIDLLLVCPESKTRQLFAKLLAQAFNLVINEYVTIEDLTEQEEPENVAENLFDEDPKAKTYKVLRGLQLMFQFMQEQVPKNWIRLESYFTFWLDIMNGGSTQIAFMMKHQFITYIVDFILDKQSPLKLYEKKHSMGNSYYSVQYENLLLIIKNLVRCCLDGQFKLSSTDKQLLYNFRFYDKVMRNLTATAAIEALCDLTVSFARNNMYYSEIVCGCVLRGINRADQDEIGTYLTVLQAIVCLEDDLKPLRIEWLIGVPQMQNHSSSRYSSQKSDLYHFGTYGTQNLDEDFLHFPSPLGWQSTLLEYIVLNRGNKQNDNQCLLTIKCLLQLVLKDETIFDFVRRIPSSNYLFKYLDDLLAWYVQQYTFESKRYFYHNFPRDAQSEETKRLLDQYQEKLILFERSESDYIIGKSIQVIQNRRYLYGIDQRTNQRVIIDEQAPHGKEQWKLAQQDLQFEKICILEDRIYKAFVCDNLPNGQTNEALPSLYVKGTQFYTYSVQPKTMAANFIQTQNKQWNNANYYEGEEEPESREESIEQDSFDQSQLPDNQRVLNPGIVECVRQVSVHSTLYKQIQAVVHITDPDGTAPHYVPRSAIQSMIQPNSTAFMFTTKKHSRAAQLNQLKFELEFKPLDVEKDSHLYLSTAQQQDLALLHP